VSGPPGTREVLSGWGRTAPSGATVLRPLNGPELRAAADTAPARGLLARGLGRSYGDAAQNAGGVVLDTTRVDHIVELDPDAALVRVGAGASLDALLRDLVPRGFFVPVSPGTRYVTVGGAIASDVHGKNHHLDGTWCTHVPSMALATPAEGVVEVGPGADPALFWATAGGMGLTGVVVEATVALPRIETSRLLVDTDRTADLDEAMAIMEAGDIDAPYSVAWVDLLAQGAATGRSVVTSGRFARRDDLPAARRRNPLRYDARPLATVPRPVPPGLLNRATVRAFNELWYRKAPRRREAELQTIPAFFHPLDVLGDWNRLYGPAGFVQWQVVVPFAAADVLRSIVGALSRARCPSPLAVLKRFGPANPGPLSFPMAGWTLAVDVAAGADGLGPVLDALDEQVAAAGGRVYLAKDSRLRPELLPAMYPRLDEWREVRARVDPMGVLRSDLGRRLGLCPQDHADR